MSQIKKLKQLKNQREGVELNVFGNPMTFVIKKITIEDVRRFAPDEKEVYSLYGRLISGVVQELDDLSPEEIEELAQRAKLITRVIVAAGTVGIIGEDGKTENLQFTLNQEEENEAENIIFLDEDGQLLGGTENIGTLAGRIIAFGSDLGRFRLPDETER
ncbi:MAG: hypothetical protein QXT97_02530 [Candidatus Diapherotrites archaeon]